MGEDCLQARIHRSLATALRLGGEGGKAVLVCADDLVFRRNFLSMLLEAANEAHSSFRPDFVLTGYSTYDLGEFEKLRRGVYVENLPATWFYGGQCLFFPAETAGAVAEYIGQFGHMAHREPNGVVINRFCRAEENLFCTGIGSEAAGPRA